MVLIVCRASVDDFFEKVEKNSDNGKKLVSWHGELVPPLIPMELRGTPLTVVL